jgi:hypothetical protein
MYSDSNDDDIVDCTKSIVFYSRVMILIYEVALARRTRVVATITRSLNNVQLLRAWIIS